MKYPTTTGHAARLLGVTEPQLSETVRRGKVRPAPWIIAGRRLWFAEHLVQAARALGILTPKLEVTIERSAPLGGQALGLCSPGRSQNAQERTTVPEAS